MANEGFSFKHLGITDPPFYGATQPIYKNTDPEGSKAQDTPFFNSKQFKLWAPEALTEYNKLIDVLVKWRDRGWCEFSETVEWVAPEQNWITWVRYFAVIQVPAEELHLHLYDMDILQMPTQQPVGV